MTATDREILGIEFCHRCQVDTMPIHGVCAFCDSRIEEPPPFDHRRST